MVHPSIIVLDALELCSLGDRERVSSAAADYLAHLYEVTWKLPIRNLLGSSWLGRRHGSLLVLAISHMSSVLKPPIKLDSESTLESHCITHSHILSVTTFWSTVVSRP